jgi:hypothetical protein
MAGAGAKLFQNGQKLFAEDVNEYLMDQTVMRFADAAARDAAFGGVGEPILAEGMMCYLMDVNVIQYYDGISWKYVGQSDTEENANLNQLGLRKIIPTNPSAGLTIATNGTVTFSAATTVAVTCFPTDFTNFRLVLNVTSAATTATGISINWRIGTGAPAATLYNTTQLFQSVGGGPTRADQTSTTFANFGATANLRAMTVADVYDVNIAEETPFISHYTAWGTAGNQSAVIYALHNSATAYDGLSIGTTSAITGSLNIYGYNT